LILIYSVTHYEREDTIGVTNNLEGLGSTLCGSLRRKVEFGVQTPGPIWICIRIRQITYIELGQLAYIYIYIYIYGHLTKLTERRDNEI
jgi:hypothetical protein